MINQNFELFQRLHTFFKEGYTKEHFLDSEIRKQFPELYARWMELHDTNSVRENTICDWETLVTLVDDYYNIDTKSRYEVLRIINQLVKDGISFDYYHIWRTKDFPKVEDRWKTKKVRKDKEKYHEFVRLAENFEYFKLLRDSILDCIQSNELLRSNMFTFSFIKGVETRLPDRKARIMELENLFESFVQIQKRITNEISFENRYSRSKLPYPKGIVLWNETFSNMKTSSSMEIISLLPERKFNTPENIFLSLCMIAISKKIAEIEQSRPDHPFDIHEQFILSKTSSRIEELINQFPFQDSLVDAQEKNKKLGSSITLEKFAHETNRRLSNHLIKNKQYSNLLFWYEKYLKLEMQLVDDFKTGIGDYLLESTNSLDLAFEYYVFFNLLDHLSKNPNIQVGKINWGKGVNNKYFEFKYYEKSFRFYQSYDISQEDTTMGLRNLSPDYMITRIDTEHEENILVGDAKNTPTSKDASNFSHLIENYMNQTGVKQGIIIWTREEEKFKASGFKREKERRHGEEYQWEIFTLNPKNPESRRYCEAICRRILRACSDSNCYITKETKLISV